MKQFLLSLLICVAAVAAAQDYEFYVVQADGNILTIANADVDHIEFSKTDPVTNETGTRFVCQEIYMKNGDVVRYPFTGMREVVFSGIITETDSVTDLGLSVDWASKNLGAYGTADYGDLIGWGDVTGSHHEQYHTSSYGAYMANKNTVLGFYGGVTPPDQISDTDLDIAKKNLGNGWRLPTLAEAQELIDRCDWMWMKYRGAEGVKITGPNGNSIFLPAGGMRRGEKMTSAIDSFGGYWTGDWYGTSDSTSSTKGEMGWALAFGITANGGYYKPNAYYRYSGLSIRPVRTPLDY